LNWARTRASAERSWRQTTWALKQPISWFTPWDAAFDILPRSACVLQYVQHAQWNLPMITSAMCRCAMPLFTGAWAGTVHYRATNSPLTDDGSTSRLLDESWLGHFWTTRIASGLWVDTSKRASTNVSYHLCRRLHMYERHNRTTYEICPTEATRL
jgi:hypothetical protein